MPELGWVEIGMIFFFLCCYFFLFDSFFFFFFFEFFCAQSKNFKIVYCFKFNP